MILHVVLIKPNPGTEPSAIEGLRDFLARLPAKIPGIVDYRFGTNVSPEGLSRGFSYGFVMTFADEAARDAYLPHPDHLKVRPLMDAVAAEVLVFDLEA